MQNEGLRLLGENNCTRIRPLPKNRSSATAAEKHPASLPFTLMITESQTDQLKIPGSRAPPQAGLAECSNQLPAAVFEDPNKKLWKM